MRLSGRHSLLFEAYTWSVIFRCGAVLVSCLLFFPLAWANEGFSELLHSALYSVDAELEDLYEEADARDAAQGNKEAS